LRERHDPGINHMKWEKDMIQVRY